MSAADDFCCPHSVMNCPWALRVPGTQRFLFGLQVLMPGSAIATTVFDFAYRPRWYSLIPELMNTPTDRLIEMLYGIVTGEFALTARDVGTIQQIEHELRRRGEEHYWSLRPFD